MLQLYELGGRHNIAFFPDRTDVLAGGNKSSIYRFCNPYFSRLTRRMEINDDLHVNGLLGCVSRGSFVCLSGGHFTFSIILPLK